MESSGCIYRQEFGGRNTWLLQVQYLSSPNDVAFALYSENPTPATPFVVSTGQQGTFPFEVFMENNGFGDNLINDEITISLDDLPSPSALTDGNIVSFKGSLLVNQFTLPNMSVTDETDNMELVLVAGNVDINCAAVFLKFRTRFDSS